MAYQSKYTGLQIDDILDSVEWKEGKIEDLEQIRAGAQKGATALQSYTEKYTGTVTGIKINGETKSGSGVIDLGTISTDISGKVDKVAGKQLSTEDFTTALKTKLEGLSNYDDTELSNALSTLRGDFDNIVSGDTTTAIKTFNEVIAFLDGLTDTQDLESIIASIEQQIAGKMDKVTLATVATSGSYNDLSNKPTIPSAVTESTVSGWGFTKNTGTITQIKANGTSVATSGVANIPAASTSAYGVTKLSSSTSSTSTTLAATSSAVKAAYDLANSKGNGTITGITMNGASKGTSGVVNLGTVITAHQDISGKQDKLVSGTNIKTINGESIVGSGNITISGGSSSGSGAYAEVNHGTSDTTFALTPNVFHVWDEVASLTLTLGDETAGVANEFLFQFNSGATATSLTLPDDIKWANDSAPTIEANKIYQISILKGLASVLEFSNSLVFPVISNTNGSNNEGYAKVYEYFVNTYNLTSTSASPSQGVAITENLVCNDVNYGGNVLKVSLDYYSRLLLWTQNAIDNYTVLYITNLGECSSYFWD